MHIKKIEFERSGDAPPARRFAMGPLVILTLITVVTFGGILVCDYFSVLPASPAYDEFVVGD